MLPFSCMAGPAEFVFLLNIVLFVGNNHWIIIKTTYFLEATYWKISFSNFSFMDYALNLLIILSSENINSAYSPRMCAVNTSPWDRCAVLHVHPTWIRILLQVEALAVNHRKRHPLLSCFISITFSLYLLFSMFQCRIEYCCKLNEC